MSGPRRLDRLDRRILQQLQAAGRQTWVELAAAVGLSPSPCLERVRRLEKDGVIRGYAALVEPSAVGASLLVFVEISLDYTTPDIFERFRAAVAGLPQIQECHLVSGNFDYLLKARIGDMAEYRELLGLFLRTLPGVRDSRSFVVMETVKETHAVFVPETG
ncbi:MAG TPA: Lrp/AsnC ligand binding domain-containing protein [Plasticicumulans sp.]|nr:Lrp/AsnC ligand binding domain-containing protein [Plasticicumulans sp.]